MELFNIGIINIVFGIGIALYFFRGLFILLRTRKLSLELKTFYTILNDTENKKEAFSTQEDLFDDYEKTVKETNFIYIQKNIFDYNKALKERGFKNVNPNDFFNEINVVERNFNLHSIDQKSPTLIGLGVFGTFVGLWFSLKGLGSETNVVNQINIINSIIPGMSAAFTTSLWGMMTSLIYSVAQKSWIGESVKEIIHINYSLATLFPSITKVEDVILDMKNDLNNLGKIIATEVGKNVSGAITGAQTNLFESFSDRVVDMGENVSHDIRTALRDIFSDKFIRDFKDIHTSLVQVTTSINEKNEMFKSVVSELPNIINKFNEMNKVSDSIYTNSLKSMLEYNRYMKGTESFLESMFKMEELQTALEKSVSIMTQSSLNSYSQIETILINISNDYKEMIETVSTTNNENITNFNTTVSTTMTDLNNLIGNTINDFTSSMNTTVTDLGTTVINSLTDFNSSVTSSINDLNSSVNNSVNSLNTSILNTTKEFNSSVDNTMTENNKVLDNVKVAIIDSSNNIKALDSTLNNKISEIAKGIDQARKDFNGQYEAMKETQSEFENKMIKSQDDFENKIEKGFGKFEGSIQSGLNEYDKTISKLTDHVKSITENLKDMMSKN